jgi:two-component system, sensor histidine kinase LadS
MIFKKDISEELAKELFENPEKVLAFVASVKWIDGYKCRKCGHDNYCEGKSPHSRRCTRCKSEESATAHTIFHNVKFPINKAFYIAYHVCVLGKDISTYDYSDQLGINQMTCWKFRKRIKDCVLKISENNEEGTIKQILMYEV